MSSSVTANVPFLSLTLPAAAGTCTPVAFWADEAISTPYLVTVDFLSDRPDVAAESLLAQPACLTLTRSPDGPVRHFHGIVRRVSAGGEQGRDRWKYTVELVPGLWFLSLTEDCRVFQAQATEAILGKLFADGGVGPVQFRIIGDKPTREYTVQMNETDLAFATRLMQEEGWFYLFQHDAGAHTLVVSDSNTAFQTLDPALMRLGRGLHEITTLSAWNRAAGTTHGETALKDYDPETPGKTLEATQATTLSVAGAAKRPLFHWPALTTAPDQVTRRTRLRIEAAEANASVVEGAGHQNGFLPGGRFTLEPDPRSGGGSEEFVLRSVLHQGTEDVFRGGGNATSYSNSFTAFPAAQVWRDLPTVERPAMAGLYSATVIGPEGEQIHTDKFGRIKIRFPWDRKRDSTPGGSIWVRVVQPWTGNTWGVQFLPRIGTEVAVAFLDGDIDRPVAIGGLYNGEQMPPFPLPDQKTKSGLRTRSSLGGGATDFSEFSFEDKKGEELVFLHAQKDLTTEVENDQTLRVDNCRIVKVKKDETIEIGANQKIKVGQDRTLAVAGNQKVTITGNRDVKIEQGNDTLAVSMGNLTTKLAMGNVSVKADLGTVTIEAMQSITLKVGGSTLTVDQMGITLKGMMIKAAADLMLDAKGTMSKLSGDAMLMVKGGIVMIN